MTQGQLPPLAPYPGLRSFTRDETEVFFGRDGAVHDMLGRLSASRFLAVLGSSGSGKSSLVRTGMLEGLEMGLIAAAGSQWRIIDIRPGGDPLRALAQALCAPGAEPGEIDQMRAFLLEGPRALVEWARGMGTLGPRENLLLLVDQFEELFRYRDYEGHQEAEAFVALILESARSRDVPIYVTITMRSEYLGACALFNGLAEAMNQGQYLTPRLGREQCRAAIEGPAAVCGFALEPELVTALLNDLARFAPWQDAGEGDLRAQLDLIGRRADQLPLLQHVLNRLWLQAVERGDAATPGGIVLRVADYTALGGLRGAIDQHADSIADGLPPNVARLVPAVFRALTTGSNVAEAVRRPTRLSTLAQVCGSDLETVTAVVAAFRDPGRNFLTPPPPAPLLPDTVIDISHESLIRQWTRLSGWLEAEASDTISLRRLDEAADREATGRGELLDGRDLAPLAAWRKDSALPTAWAARYIRDPDRALDFLDRSVRKAAKKQRDRRLLQAGALAVGIVIAGLTTVFLLERSRSTLLQSQNLALVDEKAALQAGVAELKVEAASIRAEAEAVRQEAAARRAEAEAAEKEAEAAKAIADTAQTEAAAARAEAEAALADAAAASAEATAASAEAEAASAEALAAEAEAEAARAEVDAATAEAVAARATARDLTETATALRSELEAVATRYLETARFVVEADLLQGGTPFLPDAIAALQLLSPAYRAPFASAATWTVVQQRAFGRLPATPDLTATMTGTIGALSDINDLGLNTSPFTLMRGPETADGDQTYGVVDRRSGHVAHRLTLPFAISNEASKFAVSKTGRTVLIQDLYGRLVRWDTEQPLARRVLDDRWLDDSYPSLLNIPFLSSVAFDEATGVIGIQYSRNNLDYVTLLPPSGATDAPHWRKSDILAALKAASEVPGADLGTIWVDQAYLDFVGLHDGALVMMVWPTPDSSVFAVHVDMTTGAFRRLTPALGPPGSYATLSSTRDPDRFNLVFQPRGQSCAIGGAVPGAIDPADTLIDALTVCFGVLDATSGAIEVTDPVYAQLSDTLLLPADPIDTGKTVQSTVFARGYDTPLPPVMLSPASDPAAPGSLPWLADWGTTHDGQGSTVTAYGEIEVIQHPDGVDVLTRETSYLAGLSTRPSAAGGNPDRHLLATWFFDGLLDNVPEAHMGRPLTLAPDGGLALTSDGIGDIVLHRADALPQAVALTLRAGDSCTSLMQGQTGGTRAETASPGDRGSDGGASARDPLLALVSEGITPDRALRIDGHWALVYLTTRQHYVLLELTDPAGASPVGVLHCPVTRDVTRVLAVDHATGTVVLTGKSGRQVAVWTVPADGAGVPVVRAAVMPNGQTSVAATVLGGGGVLIVGDDGALSLMPPASAPDAAAPVPLLGMKGAPLPGADRIQALGNRLLLTRPVAAGPVTDAVSDDPGASWTLAALVEVDPAGTGWTLTHAAALPVVLADIAALRPDTMPGRIEMVGRDGVMLRFGLPPVPSDQALADEVLTLASPDIVIANRTDPALATVGLVLASLSQEMAQPPLRAALSCAGQIEAAIAGLRGIDTSLAPANAPCTDPGALDLIAVLARPAASMADAGFGPRERALLARAGAGDALALRALLAIWSNDAGLRPTDPALVAASLLDQHLSTPGTDGTGDSLALTDPASGDAAAHLRLARRAMEDGESLTAFLHAWIGESILSAAGLPDQTATLRALRLAAGSRLDAGQRLSVLQDLRNWTPVFPAPGPDPDAPADLDADLAALDRMAAQSGLGAEIDLVKLARLDMAVATAPDDARAALLRRMADHVLSVSGWPKGIARRTALASRIDDLRRALSMAGQDQDLRLSLRLDAALISMLEADGNALPFDRPEDMALYAGALGRLTAANPALLSSLAPDLRFVVTALDYSFDDYGDFAGLTPVDLANARQRLATAIPGATGSAIVQAATPFWRGVTLDRDAVNATGDLAASLRTQSVADQIASFDALLTLFDAGQLASTQELALLSTVAFWALNDMPPERVRAEEDRLDKVAKALTGLLATVEETGATVPFIFPVWNLAVLADTRANKYLPVGAENAFGTTDDKVRRLILQSLVHGSDWLALRHKGEIDFRSDEDTFASGRFTYQIAFATAYIAARQRAEAGLLEPAGRCDALTSYPYDPDRRAPGVIFARVIDKADEAVAACRADLAAARAGTGGAPPDEAREAALMYMLGRALDAQAGGSAVAPTANPLIEACYQAATQKGHLSAMRNLIPLYPDEALPLRKVHHDLMLRDHMTTAYSALEGLPMTDEDRAALLVLVRAAADLKSAPANLLLGRIEPRAEDRATRLLIAAELLESPTAPGDSDLAMTARMTGNEILAGLDEQTRSAVQGAVTERVTDSSVLTFDLRDILYDKYVENAETLCR